MQLSQQEVNYLAFCTNASDCIIADKGTSYLFYGSLAQRNKAERMLQQAGLPACPPASAIPVKYRKSPYIIGIRLERLRVDLDRLREFLPGRPKSDSDVLVKELTEFETPKVVMPQLAPGFYTQEKTPRGETKIWAWYDGIDYPQTDKFVIGSDLKFIFVELLEQGLMPVPPKWFYVIKRLTVAWNDGELHKIVFDDKDTLAEFCEKLEAQGIFKLRKSKPAESDEEIPETWLASDKMNVR